MYALGQKQKLLHLPTNVRFTPESGHHFSLVPRVDILAESLRLTSSVYRRASAMGFNRRKMEDQRREAAEKEAATRRATDAQVLEDAERLDRRLERAPGHQRTHDLFADDRHRH